VFDDITQRGRRGSPPCSHPISAAYFGTAAFAVRLLRLDQKLADGVQKVLDQVRAGDRLRRL
jgi:hypothetical protein